MVNHTRSDMHDPAMAIPGHNSLLAYIHETKQTGLHCVDCGWYAGRSFKGRWAEKQMAEAWQGHVDFVQAGGIIEHGRASNVEQGVCRCVSCSIPWRMEQNQRASGR